MAMDFKNHKASLVMRMKNESLREIYTSEKKYVESLLVMLLVLFCGFSSWQVCMEQFYHPMLRASAARPPVVTRVQVNDIFSTLEIIVELNKVICRRCPSFFFYPSLQESSFRLAGPTGQMAFCAKVWRLVRENVAYFAFVFGLPSQF